MISEELKQIVIEFAEQMVTEWKNEEQLPDKEDLENDFQDFIYTNYIYLY